MAANVGDVFRLSILGSVFGEPHINTFSYAVTAAGAGDPNAALITAFTGACLISYRACLSADWLGQQLISQGVKPVTIVGTSSIVGSNGTSATPTAPTQVATIITRKTATPGKGGRGRIFFGAVTAGLIVSDQVTGALVTAYNAFISAVNANILGSGYTFQPVLFKRKTLTAPPIINHTLNTVVKTRRSRALGTRFHRRKRHTVGSI
jgi:hypothetical protein